jgi:2-polyprenyl-3-methyl-5-hydroxy-6-metoxy-1,4-benzoquinol methylase
MSQPDKELDIASDRAHSFRDRFDGRQFATTYKDIPIFAAPGVHELALERLSEALPLGDGVEVLELGAGGGAMSLRLADAGYRVTSSDLFEGSFTPAGKIPFLTLDLNQSFADRLLRQFDAVVALELIEHLENPNHFFRQCRRLLKPGGHLLVSTPNLVNPVSQAMFLRQGVFQWFRDEDYRDQGHIMPLAPAVLRRCWTEGGFDCRWEGSVSDPMRMLHRRLDRRSRWLAKLLAACSGTPEALRGEVYLAILRASRPG